MYVFYKLGGNVSKKENYSYNLLKDGQSKKKEINIKKLLQVERHQSIFLHKVKYDQASTSTQAYLGGVAGFIPDHCSKTGISVK